MGRSNPTIKYEDLLETISIYQREWNALREGMNEIRAEPQNAKHLAEIYLAQNATASTYDFQVEAIIHYLRRNMPRINSTRIRLQEKRGSVPPSEEPDLLSEEDYNRLAEEHGWPLIPKS